ncbi:MAG: hypothetical protein KGI97_05345 [Alphaproteobacteria bacterium]|nr:hypothetical protein [Alphaproteobacteria bacterium]
MNAPANGNNAEFRRGLRITRRENVDAEGRQLPVSAVATGEIFPPLPKSENEKKSAESAEVPIEIEEPQPLVEFVVEESSSPTYYRPGVRIPLTPKQIERYYVFGPSP